MHGLTMFEYILKRNHDIGRRYTEVENIRYFFAMFTAALRTHCPECCFCCKCCPQDTIEDVHKHDFFHRHHVIAAAGGPKEDEYSVVPRPPEAPELWVLLFHV